MKIITKLDVQKRVLKDGKLLHLDRFSWDETTRIFESHINDLVLDFSGIDDCSFETGDNCNFEAGDNCKFKTGSKCIFKTGNNCSFKTTSYCLFITGNNCSFATISNCSFITGDNCSFNIWSFGTFKTGNKCSFKAGSDCKFETGDKCSFDTWSDCKFITGDDCIVNRLDTKEIIYLKPNIETILCPYEIRGYIFKKDDKYVHSKDEENEYVIIDNILSGVISRKGNVLKVKNRKYEGESYIIQDGDIYSHGETIEEARESLMYKISDRDKSMYKGLTLNSILSKEECIKMYRVITGACEYGTRKFIESLIEIKSNYSIKEIIKLTKGQYGNLELMKFMKSLK